MNIIVKLEVITPERTLYSGSVESVTVPGTKGEFMVLHNHAPIISTLEEGNIKIVGEHGGSESIEIAGGIIEVKKNHIIVLADV